MARTKDPRHPITKSVYWNKYFPRLDKMHVVDLKGVHAICCGSILLDLVTSPTRTAVLGATQDQRLLEINRRMKDFQSTSGCEHYMPELRIDNLRKDGWACLNGKLVKAANTRQLIPFMLHLVGLFYNAHGAYASSVRKVVTALNTIEHICYSADMFLTTSEKQTFDKAWKTVGRHWQHLRWLCRPIPGNEGFNYWQVTPKVHYAMHLPRQSLLINVRATQCYAEESLIGRVSKIWAASANGRYTKMVQKTTLIRYLVSLELRLSP